MDKELYIDGELVDLEPDTVVAFTMQINDVANLESRNGNFTNQIKVPYTKKNKEKLGYSQQITSGTQKPYRKLPVKYVDGGAELIPAGYATIDNSDDAFEVTIFNGNSDIFAIIDGLKLSDLDLSDLDHTWTLANILAANNNSEGYIYPIIDYSNRINNANVSQKVWKDSLYPALFRHTLISRIFTQKGWTVDIGNLVNENRYMDSVLALSQKFQNPNTFFNFVNGTKTGYTDSTTLDPTQYNKMKFVVNNTGTIGQWYNNTTGATLTDLHCSPKLTFIAQNNFTANSWISPSTILINIAVDIKLNYVTGAAQGSGSTSTDFMLKIFNKTQNVLLGSTLDFQSTAGLVLFQSTSGTLEFNNTISLAANENVNEGDELIFFFYVNPSCGFQIDLTLTQCAITIAPEQIISDGAKIYMTYQVPDMSQTDFLKAIFNEFCITPDADSSTKTVRFRRFDELVDNIENAKDWSDKFVEQEPNVSYRQGTYYQINDFSYKQDYNIPLLYGNANFNIADENLDVRGDIVQQPFGSSIESLQTCIRNNGNVESIPDIDLSKNNITPRCFVLRRQTITGGLIYNSATGNTTVSSTIPFCHFALQGFNGLHFQELLPTYWNIISAIVNKAKFISGKLKLNLVDVYKFDFFIPVYISQLSNYFYVNKINNFKSGQLTNVELIRIDASSLVKPQPIPNTQSYRLWKNGDRHLWANGDKSLFKQ